MPFERTPSAHGASLTHVQLRQLSKKAKTPLFNKQQATFQPGYLHSHLFFSILFCVPLVDGYKSHSEVLHLDALAPCLGHEL